MKLSWKTRLRIRKARMIVKDYSWAPPFKKASPNLTIVFNRTGHYGGLLDRIKGMVSAKLVADKAGLSFQIYHDSSSFNIFKFILPNDNSILSDTSSFDFNFWKHRIVLMNDTVKYSQQEILDHFASKSSHHFYCNLDFTKVFFSKEQAPQKWREIFWNLFHFSDSIKKQAKDLLGDEETGGIHLRFTTILGDFADSTQLVLSAPERDALIQLCANHVFQLVQKNPYKQFLVVSDSILFLNYIKSNAHLAGDKKIVIPEGNIGHVDLQRDDSVLEKSVLDFYLLTQCKKIMQVKENRMYNSQYSQYAAVLSGADYELHKI